MMFPSVLWIDYYLLLEIEFTPVLKNVPKLQDFRRARLSRRNLRQKSK
jgi:hypothetical protein